MKWVQYITLELFILLLSQCLAKSTNIAEHATSNIKVTTDETKGNFDVELIEIVDTSAQRINISKEYAKNQIHELRTKLNEIQSRSVGCSQDDENLMKVQLMLREQGDMRIYLKYLDNYFDNVSIENNATKVYNVVLPLIDAISFRNGYTMSGFQATLDEPFLFLMRFFDEIIEQRLYIQEQYEEIVNSTCTDDLFLKGNKTIRNVRRELLKEIFWEMFGKTKRLKMEADKKTFNIIKNLKQKEEFKKPYQIFYTGHEFINFEDYDSLKNVFDCSLKNIFIIISNTEKLKNCTNIVRAIEECDESILDDPIIIVINHFCKEPTFNKAVQIAYNKIAIQVRQEETNYLTNFITEYGKYGVDLTKIINESYKQNENDIKVILSFMDKLNLSELPKLIKVLLPKIKAIENIKIKKFFAEWLSAKYERIIIKMITSKSDADEIESEFLAASMEEMFKNIKHNSDEEAAKIVDGFDSKRFTIKKSSLFRMENSTCELKIKLNRLRSK